MVVTRLQYYNMSCQVFVLSISSQPDTATSLSTTTTTTTTTNSHLTQNKVTNWLTSSSKSDERSEPRTKSQNCVFMNICCSCCVSSFSSSFLLSQLFVCFSWAKHQTWPWLCSLLNTLSEKKSNSQLWGVRSEVTCQMTAMTQLLRCPFACLSSIL